MCHSIWDGWSCHPSTYAGKISKVKCPAHFIADTCNSILGIINYLAIYRMLIINYKVMISI
jgi:hypothetical protein